MRKDTEGSLVVIIVGLFWLLGIITAVLYALTSHLQTVMTLREQQAQYWQLLQGGMLTAVASMNDNAKFYLHNQEPLIFYEGPWYMDARHAALRINLSLYRAGDLPEGKAVLKGRLGDSTKDLITVLWYLAYHDYDQRWHYRYAERVYH